MHAIVSKVVATAAATAAATGAHKAASFGWERVTGKPPPTAAEVGDDRDLRDLILWVAVVTLAVALARKLATRSAERLT